MPTIPRAGARALGVGAIVLASLAANCPPPLPLTEQPEDADADLQAAFYAKALCSGLWVGGREPNDFVANDLPFASPEDLDELEFDIATERRAVTGRMSGVAPRTAIFHEGHGCTILPRGATDVFFTPAAIVPPTLSDETPWPRGRGVAADSRLDPSLVERAMARAFADREESEPIGTRAVVVVHEGKLVAERYLPGFDASSVLIGWSMGKSLTAALVGLLIEQGELELDEPAPVELWRQDSRSEITVRHLLNMSSGLDFQRYTEPGQLFTADNHHLNVYFGEPDVFRYSADRSLAHAPGTVGRYRNSDPLVLGSILRRRIEARGLDYQTYPYTALFHRIGMTSLVMERDLRGNMISSGYDHATPRDFARFGLLHLRDGDWFGERLLPEGWSEFVSSPAPGWEEGNYGGLFWLNRFGYFPGAPRDAYFARGALGQFTVILPSHDLVVVRMGHSPHGEAIRRSLGETLSLLSSAVESSSVPDLATENSTSAAASAP